MKWWGLDIFWLQCRFALIKLRFQQCSKIKLTWHIPYFLYWIMYQLFHHLFAIFRNAGWNWNLKKFSSVDCLPSWVKAFCLYYYLCWANLCPRIYLHNRAQQNDFCWGAGQNQKESSEKCCNGYPISWKIVCIVSNYSQFHSLWKTWQKIPNTAQFTLRFCQKMEIYNNKINFL